MRPSKKVFAWALLGAAALASQPGLQQVQSVYLMPMGYGLDQYLANRLTAEGIFQVVTDPKRADAVMTDNIGAGFERRFDEMFSAPPPPPEPPAAEGEKPKSKDLDPDTVERLKQAGRFPVSSFSRGKGNVFLVNVKDRSVVWSLYERPRKIVPDELDRTSARIVQRLKRDRSGKP